METNQQTGNSFNSLMERVGANIQVKLDTDENEDTRTEEQKIIDANKEAEAANNLKSQANNVITKSLGLKTTPTGIDTEDKTNKNNIESDNLSSIEYLASKYGITEEQKALFDDLDFKSNDIDAIKQFADTYFEKIGKNNARDEVFEKYPDVKELIEHLEEGKSLNSWREKQQSFDWGAIKVEPTEIDKQEQIMSVYYQSKGIPNAKIAKLIEDAKDGATLHAEAVAALKELDTVEKSRLAEIEAKEIKAAEQRKTETKKIIDEVNNIIKVGKLLNLTIPETDKKAFSNDILLNRGKIYDSLNTEQSLFVDFIARAVKNNTLDKIKFGVVEAKKPIVTKNNNPLKTVSDNETGIEKQLGVSDLRKIFGN